MFGMAGETQFDLRFRAFGIPVRVHPIFWLSGAMLSWYPERPALIIVGMIACFFCILIHELGHAVMYRRYGYRSEIVLYFLGGYATGQRLPMWQTVAVSAAGPLAGMALLIPLEIAFRMIYHMDGAVFDEYLVVRFFFRHAIFFAVLINLMNLVPTLPLDGGHIMSALVQRYGNGGRRRIQEISIFAAGLVAAWGGIAWLKNWSVLPLWRVPAMLGLKPEEWLCQQIDFDGKFLAIFFGILCVLQIQAYREWRY